MVHYRKFLDMPPYFFGHLFNLPGGVDYRHGSPLFPVPGQEGTVPFPDLKLKFQVFIDILGLPGLKPLLGCFGIQVEKEEQFRQGEGPVQKPGQFFAAVNSLVYQRRKNIPVGNNQFTPARPFGNPVRAVEMFIPVRRKEPG
jgi:hypothetical protein